MPSAPDQPSSFTQPPPLRQRLTGGVLALAITALLVLMMLTLAPPFDRRPPAHSGLSSFGILPEQKAPAKAKSQTKRRTVATAAKAAATTPARPAERPDTSAWPAEVIMLSRKDFAASDIAKLPTHERPAESAEAGGSGSAHGATSGHGSGPGGEDLYNADWYVRPTSAQLGFYMPKSPPPEGYGEIACRTVEKYRVEDCRILGESPAGSGFGRAVMDAAWQFKVLPPRVGNRPLVGAWVSIRIDYYRKGDELVGSSH